MVFTRSICSRVIFTAAGPVTVTGIHTDQNWPPT